jgi:hypothetical protein
VFTKTKEFCSDTPLYELEFHSRREALEKQSSVGEKTRLPQRIARSEGAVGLLTGGAEIFTILMDDKKKNVPFGAFF